MAPSRHDWNIVDWDVKPQHKQTNKPLEKILSFRNICKNLPKIWTNSPLLHLTTKSGRNMKLIYTYTLTKLYLNIELFLGITEKQKYVQLVIHRDYYMSVFISYPISTWDSHISPRAEGLRADTRVEGWCGSRGLIGGMIWKLTFHNLFIIYFIVTKFVVIHILWPTCTM